MLRFQFVNQYVGELVIDKNDPIDINNISKQLRRSKDNYGVFRDIVLELRFIEESAEYLRKAFENGGGIDSVVNVFLYKNNENTYEWDLYYEGKVNFGTKYKNDFLSCTVNLEQIGIDRDVMNNLETSFDSEAQFSNDGKKLADQEGQFSAFHSKRIFVQSVKEIKDNDSIEYNSQSIVPNITQDIYITIPFESQPSDPDDVEDFSEVGFATFASPHPISAPPSNQLTDVSLFNWKIKDAGTYKFKFSDIYGKITTHKTPDVGNENHTLQLVVTHGTTGNYDDEIIATVTGLDDNDLILDEEEAEEDIVLQVGDEVYVYFKHITPGYTGVLAEWEFFTSDVDKRLKLDLSALTSFAETEVKNLMIHEIFDRGIAYVTGEVGLFYSTLLGRTDIGYESDGQLGLIAMTVGTWLRGRTDFLLSSNNTSGVLPQKIKMFHTLQSLIRFVNSITPVGFGFEIVDGKKKFVLEKIEHFFDKNTRSASLGMIDETRIESDIVPDMYYNKIIYGYNQEIDMKIVNGIDSFNTYREASMPLKNTKNPLDISTEIITDGHAIESQRRLTGTTVDSSYDDKNFACVMERHEGAFRSKRMFPLLAEALIYNVVDASSGYNYDITPRTNLKNWGNIIASPLHKSFNKIIKFSKGTLNYGMGKKATILPGATIVYENSDFDVTNYEPIWEPIMFTLKDIALSDEVLKSIETNLYAYVDFQDSYGVTFEGFIMPGSSIQHYPDQQKADVVLLKVYRKKI